MREFEVLELVLQGLRTLNLSQLLVLCEILIFSKSFNQILGVSVLKEEKPHLFDSLLLLEILEELMP